MTNTKTSMRIFILGATGGIGRQLVDQALERHHRVTAFVRSPQKLGAARDALTVIRGDVHNTDAMRQALAGHDSVLSALGPPGPARNTITSDSARATIAAMQSAGMQRLLVVGVAALFPDIGMFGRLLRNTLLRNIADDSAEMERIVKASGLDWTIVRPPRLTNGPRRGRYAVADDHLPNGAGGNAAISRADVAHFMLDEVEEPGHLRRVVGIAYTRSASS
jgi:putative NADH-flavin reductase